VGFQNPLGEVIFYGRREFGDQQIEQDRKPLPLPVCGRQKRRQEFVGADKRLGLALEVHLSVFIQLILIYGHAYVEDGVKPVAISAAEKQLHHLLDLFRRIHLRPVEIRFQVVEFVGVGFIGQQGGPVIILESVGDGLAVVLEVEHEAIAFLRMRPV